MSNRIPAVVIGVGRMGQHHARNYAQIPDYQLLAVCDANIEQARKIAELHHCAAFASVQELLASGISFACATVATPTIYHRAIAEVLLPAGIDLLIEKPLAPNRDDAQAIVTLAHHHKRILQVGHTERFNPALRALSRYQLRPKFVEVTRISPMTFRSIDVGVVLDLMIHDLDIVHHLVGSPVKEVVASGVSVISRHEDIANARLTFANGCVANLTASRLALKTERKMRLFSPNAYVTVDYQKKSGVIITRTANEEELARVQQKIASGDVGDLSQLNYPELVNYEELKVVDQEPLRAELEAFAESIRTRSRPAVTGEDGLAAVDIAGRIASSIAEQRWQMES